MTRRALLLADPDPAVREGLGALLQRDGPIIHSASDSAEVLDCARRTCFDLVITRQDRGDCQRLLRRLRAITPQTRVILTGEPDSARVLTAMREQAFSYFQTPVPQTALADMAQRALETTAWRGDIKLLPSTPEWVELEVCCKLVAAERVTHFVREIERDLPGQACADVTAAFRELALNAVEHGGGSDPRNRVRVSLVRTPRALIARIRDPGKGFSLEELPHAALSNPGDSPALHTQIREEQGRRPGGFGILMARGLVHELKYNQRGNEVIFIKYLR